MKKCCVCLRTKSFEYFYRNCRNKDLLTSRCIGCIKISYKIRFSKNKKKFLEWGRKSYYKNKEKYRERNALKYRNIMIKLFDTLGNECRRCGISDKRILQLDHINGGGSIDRKANSAGYIYFEKIVKRIKSGDNGFQVLCANCNLIEGIEKGYKKSIWN